MKFKLQPENPLEWIAMKLNLAPIPLVDTQIAFNKAMAIMSAAELGIYEALGKSEKTADDVAKECSTSPEATRHLLDSLVGIGYLKWSNGRYSLKPRYYKWLLKENESNLVGKLKFQLSEWNWMGKLPEYVRTGQPMELHQTVSATEWASYQEGMRDLSVNAAKEVAGKLKLPKGAAQMLDIGGSHGLYSVEMCKKNPGLKSTILELAGAVESASAIASRYNKDGAVQYKTGNALTDDLGAEQYDLIMINNVVHHFTVQQNKELARKIARALKPGGIYAIGEIIRAQKPGEGGVIGATTGLYFSLTSSSGTWSVNEMQSWQREAGLKIEKTISLMTVPGFKIIVARK